MPTSVQVTPGSQTVARFGDVTAWFETDSLGGGVMVTQVVQILRSVASGAVAARDLGSRLAAVLTTGDHNAVPALVAAVAVADGLQVVVHGWGAVVADELRIPNGWLDEVLPGRSAWWIGRNTETPIAPVVGSPLELSAGIVRGCGAGIAFVPDPDPEPRPEPEPEPEVDPADANPPTTVVIDDGRTLHLTTGYIVGTAPDGSGAVRQGHMAPLVLTDPTGSVREVHAEIRVDGVRVAVVDATDGATHVLPPGATEWELVDHGKVLELQAGTRVAIGTRILHFQ